MDHKKWLKYLRIPNEPFAASEQEDNMKFYGKEMLKYKKVLDVGCGTGLLVNWLRGKGIDAQGITITQKEVSVGKARYGKDHPIRYGDMHEIPFGDSSFDAINSKDSFEHSLAPYVVLCEFNRLLKDGGFCLIVVPDVRQWQNEDYHYSLFYSDQMKQLFNKTNFKMEKAEAGPPPVGGTIFTSYFLKKKGNIKF